MRQPMKVTKELLEQLGFQHSQFPDGWFWYLSPDTDEGIRELGMALGFIQSDVDELPDTIILQCEDTITAWDYVYGPEVGPLTAEAAETVLARLAAAREA